MNNLQKTLLGLTALTISLFGIVGCSNEKITPTPLIREQSVNQRDIKKEERTKPYLANLTAYKEIPVDEWLTYYPNGLIVITDSEVDKRLRGKSLTPERVMAGNNYGSVKEYVTFKDTETSEVYFATIDALSGMTEDVESSTEINEKIRNNGPELFSSILTNIENNKSPIPSTEKIIQSENPYAVGTALNYVLKDIEIIDIANGEVYSFTSYNAKLNSGKLEFELSGTPEATLVYLMMAGLGINYTIPFVEKDLGMIVGEKLTEGKIWESPLTTKTNVKISYEPGSNEVNVSGTFGDSALVRITKYTYYSVKAGKSLKAEEVPLPLKEYNFETSIDPKKTLETIGNYIAEKNRETEKRQEQERKQGEKTISTAVPAMQTKVPQLIATAVAPVQQLPTKIPQAIQTQVSKIPTQIPSKIQTVVPELKERGKDTLEGLKKKIPPIEIPNPFKKK